MFCLQIFLHISANDLRLNRDAVLWTDNDEYERYPELKVSSGYCCALLSIRIKRCSGKKETRAMKLTERHETMRSLEELLRENNLKDPEDIDALIELAEITGQMICDEQYSDIELLINYIISNDCYEAFSWMMAEMQEEFDKKERCGLKNFACFIGKSIANYDEFIKRLQVDLHAIDNDTETIMDCDGEVQSFFNILTYKTAYGNIFLVTEENFDTRDNDFIRYKLLFKNGQ